MHAMKVLVTYATRHGSTAGIASRIAAVLNDEGHPARAVPVESVEEVGAYDAVVLGGAAYLSHWLKAATRFAYREQQALATRPVWLFSSGPLGTAAMSASGRDARLAARPSEFSELRALLHPRGDRVFFGAYDPTQPPGDAGEQLARSMSAEADLPPGDFRDWDDIERWARQIATELTSCAA